MIVMPKSKQVFSTRQQTKFQQLQLEVAALEEQVQNALQEQLELTQCYDSQGSIPLVHVNDRIARTGIKLAHDI